MSSTILICIIREIMENRETYFYALSCKNLGQQLLGFSFNNTFTKTKFQTIIGIISTFINNVQQVLFPNFFTLPCFSLRLIKLCKFKDNLQTI